MRAYNYIIIPIMLIIALSGTQCMLLTVPPSDNKCLSQDKAIGETIGIVYFISGENEVENIVQIKDKDNNVIWESKNKSNGSYSSAATVKGLYSLCIYNTSNKLITVTFAFSEVNKDQQILSVQSIESLSTVVLDVRKKLDNIHFGIRNSAVRRIKHSEIARNINSKITMYTTIKVVFLLLFSVFQLMMVTSIFKNMKVQSYISISQKKSGMGGKRNADSETSIFL